MKTSPTIADFTAALDATRAKLRNMNVEIEKLESERQRIATAPPHTDDIIGVLQRGLSNSVAEFERQLAGRLSDQFTGHDGKSVEAVGPQKAMNILRLEATTPSSEELVTRAMRGQLPDLNVAVLTFFLRDGIEAAIPGLVDRLLPASRTGMRGVDRSSALEVVDAQLAALKAERDELLNYLGQARAAINTPGRVA